MIVIDDDGDEIQVAVPTPEAPPLPIKVEHEDIPQDSDESDHRPVPRGSTRTKVQRRLFSSTTKGPYHKVVGSTETGEDCEAHYPRRTFYSDSIGRGIAFPTYIRECRI